MCLLIFLNLLCFASPFRRLQVHSSSFFWCLPPVGEVGSVACVGFLVEGTGTCVLVGVKKDDAMVFNQDHGAQSDI